MLDINKIFQDIDNLGKEQAMLCKGLKDELTVANQVISVIRDDLDTARSQIENAKTSWLTANFDISPDKTYGQPALPANHAAAASDGSQIMPDKNEAALCYLINAASIILYYGKPERPVASTYPALFYREDDIWENDYGGQRVRMSEKLIGVKRTIAEMNALESAVILMAKSGLPSVAFWDGSLIFWTIQDEPEPYRSKVLGEYIRAFDTARELKIPIVGYISDPGSRDFVNSMKIMLCDQLPVNCDKCCHKTDGSPAPCDSISALKDNIIFKNRLRESERSVIMTSKSKVLKSYGDHDIRMFYLNVGSETARVEIPAWAAEDDSMLNLIHAVCYDQAVKGRGYPVVLSEAHEHAVIRSQERTVFYELLERSLIKHGAQITRSAKRLSKNY